MSNYGLQSLFNESVSQITATNSVALGTKRYENGKEYIYVYNMSTSTATIGYGVMQSAASAYSVTLSGPTGSPVFGVVQNTDLEPHYYGWALVRGVGSAEAADDAVSLGISGHMEVFQVENDGFAQVSTGATGSTWAARACGYALENIATGSSGSVYFRCYA